MTNTDFYLYMFIGILGVAYPVLLQVIARLDDKYSSNHILEIFTEERGLKYFQGTLLISFVLIVIWTIVYYVYYLDLTPQYVWIEDLIKILLSVMVTILAGVFLHLVNKVITYYTPAKLYEQLSARHNKVSEGSTWLRKWKKTNNLPLWLTSRLLQTF